jgi:glycerol-3-phosphate O-acyltransferase
VLTGLANSQELSRAVAELSDRLGRGRDEVRAEVSAALSEMAAAHGPAAMFAWRRLGRWLLRGYDLTVDREAIAELRRLDEDHTLVWLPSHRSYLDTWALPAVLDQHDFPPYFVMGGANLDFWPFGDLARRTGLVFIRRTVRDDPVYRLALRQYLAHLVRTKADFGWSIEGGRTRTGKLRPPRHGLLRYLADTVQAERDRRVLLVPVSIVYDRLQEVPLMTAEARGAAKRPEDVRWLLDFARRQGEDRGRVYIDFGEPLPLAERLDELEREEGGTRHGVERVAVEVCHRINRVTPVIPAAVMTLALLAADRALTLDEAVAHVEPLAAYLARRGCPVACDERLDDRSVVEATLDELTHADAAVCFDSGRETVWWLGPQQHLVAAFYRNSALHFLIARAIAGIVADYVGDDTSDAARGVGEGEALRLRALLKFEFFFPGKGEFLDDVRTELAMVREDRDPSRMQIAHLVLRPFLEAYLVVAEELAACDPTQPIDEDAFKRRCLGSARQWLLQRRLTSAESVSLELLGTGLRLARNRGLCEPGGPELALRRRSFADELRESVLRVRAIVERRRAQLDAAYAAAPAIAPGAASPKNETSAPAVTR